MAANKTATPAKKQAAIPPGAIVIGRCWYWAWRALVSQPRGQAARRAPPPPLTGPAKEYVKYLKFVSADGQTLKRR